MYEVNRTSGEEIFLTITRNAWFVLMHYEKEVWEEMLFETKDFDRNWMITITIDIVFESL